MKLFGIIYKGPEIDDLATYNGLPKDLKIFLKEANGLIAYSGGLHIRGCCFAPEWHSINEVWIGKNAFWKHYADVLDIDIPFAQDCMGDQFLLRNNKVVKLYAEKGEVEELRLNLWEFFEEMEKDPVSFLSLQPLMQFEMEGNKLEPGTLISAFPPFCMNSGQELTLNKMPVLERLQSLQNISKQVKGLEDGDEVRFIVE